MIEPIDYSQYLNQSRLNMATGLFGSNADNKIAGIPGDVLAQYNSLRANAKALKKLQELEKNGGVGPTTYNDAELLSDRFLNDHYDPTTKKVIKATYTPDPTSNPTVDSKATAGENLDSMRRLALAAIRNPDSLSGFHHGMFDKLRETIANGLVTNGSSNNQTVITGDAEAAKVSKPVGNFHLLVDDQGFAVAGSKGEKTYSFAPGDSLESIAAAINADAADTGVLAEVTKGEDGNYAITMTSTEKGKDKFVKVTQKQGDLFGESGSTLSANGKDATTTDVEVVESSDNSTAALAAGLYTGKSMEGNIFTINGSRGSQNYTFEHGTSAEDIVAAINGDTEATGVKAEVIYNSNGEAEGIGLVADKAGSNHFIGVTQTEGSLFAQPGKSVKVSGASKGSDSEGPGIVSLNDLGKVTVDNISYSFADLGPGGSAALGKNPNAALAVIDQALRDIYEGRAVVKGFDPKENPMPNMPVSNNSVAGNTLEIGNYGSKAMTDWVNALTKDLS